MKNNCKNEKTELEPARSTAFEMFLESLGNKEEAKLIAFKNNSVH